MNDTRPGRRLSAQDAAYLHFEQPQAPLHIGSIAILEGALSGEEFALNLDARIHEISRYQQRAIVPPFHVGLPTWEFDPDFDIRRHVHSVRIEPPGSAEQLLELAADLFAEPLDRTRPLWEIYVIEGLAGPRTACVSKVHHCLVDGVSGIELLMIMFDVTPEPPPQEPTEHGALPPTPSPGQLFRDAVWDSLEDGIERCRGFQHGLLDVAFRRDDGRGQAVLNAFRSVAPALASPAKRAPFNQPVSGKRRIAVSEFTFAEIRKMRRVADATVNDVILTVLSAALERYLRSHNHPLADEVMRVMVPVNVRQEEERGTMGNKVSMLLVEPPFGLRDPVARLQVVARRTREMKQARLAEGVAIIADALSVVPAPLQALMSVAPLPPNTLFNLICTNVPGPLVPLYAAGHRMLSHYPLVPLGWDLGLACGVTSYDQMLYIGLMADAMAMPDVDSLKLLLDESYLELRTALGVPPSDVHDVGLPSMPREGTS